MVGKYEIEIYNNRVHYFLEVKRNITILQGNSATGKTELIRLLQEYETNGASSGINVRCDVKCAVLTNVDWELRLSALRQSIIFIDESAGFLKSQRFAEAVRGSDNYFVIVTRDSLDQLPYAIDEIYGLRNASESEKYKQFRRVYNEMYRLYHFELSTQKVNPALVITEDSNAGYEFYSLIYPGKCESAGGKSRVLDLVQRTTEKQVLAIVDSAAFGSEIGKMMGFLETSTSESKCVLFAPESFEYLMLKSNILNIPKDVFEHTYDYADSKDYLSWEEFYTAYLTDLSRNTVYQYGKAKLPKTYQTPGSLRKLKAVLPAQILPQEAEAQEE